MANEQGWIGTTVDLDLEVYCPNHEETRVRMTREEPVRLQMTHEELQSAQFVVAPATFRCPQCNRFTAINAKVTASVRTRPVAFGFELAWFHGPGLGQSES